MSAAIREIERILEETDEADDALRKVVAALSEQDGVAWAAVGFLEGGDLTLGPAAGTPNEATRTRVTIDFNGERVGELHVDGIADNALLELVADRLGPYVLIGWDTGGEAWDP